MPRASSRASLSQKGSRMFRTTRRSFLVAVCLFATLPPQALFAQSDSLPLGNDAPSKEALVFVLKTTPEGSADFVGLDDRSGGGMRFHRR